MPNITVTLPEVEQSVSRPVAIAIISQIREICKIDESAEIYYPGPMGKMQVAGTDIDGQNQERFSSFEAKRRTYVEVNETFSREALGTTAVEREEYAPIFEDTKLGVKIAPVYATSDMTINVRYRTISQTEADRWLSDMRMRISMMRDVNLHKVDYHFSLPDVVEELVCHIYDLREATAPYNQTLNDYVRDCMTERLTVISDQVGKNKQMAVGERQTRIQGQFDYDGMPDKPTRNDAVGAWEIVFSYKLSYERPIGVNMKYPVMVHNRLLDAKWVNFTDRPYDTTLYPKSFSKSLHAFHAFEMDTIMNSFRSPDPFLRIPAFDDFRLEHVPQGTGTAVLALMEVGEDRHSLFNLNEMGDVVMDPDIMKFIREVEWPYICKQFLSVIHLTLYRNNNQLSTGNLICDSQLNIRSRDPLDFRNQHRVRIGVCVDMTLLPKAAIDRLRQYPRAMMKIMSSMNELLAKRPDFGSLGDKQRVGLMEFSDLYAVLTGYGYNNGQHGRPMEYYNARLDQFPIFSSIDPRERKAYQEKMIRQRTIQTGYVAAYRKN